MDCMFAWIEDHEGWKSNATPALGQSKGEEYVLLSQMVSLPGEGKVKSGWRGLKNVGAMRANDSQPACSPLGNGRIGVTQD